MPDVFIVGISGLSSTGKTTLSRYLRSIFPESFILHQDDFYLADCCIPVSVEGLQDWDCVESFDFDKLSTALQHIHTHGTPPDGMESITNKSPVGEEGLVSEEALERMRKVLKEELLETNYNCRVAILDGILMFHPESTFEDILDAKILMRAQYEVVKQRRESRTGYVTIEGFWADPPGYFDKIVWPNYVKYHKHLFVDGNPEKELILEATKERKIHSPPDISMPMGSMVEWAVRIIIQGIKSKKNTQ